MVYNKTMTKLLRTIQENVIVEQEINKSKFITYLALIEDEEAAKEFLRSIKKMHPKAAHHCSAYMVGEIERSNDDGEPASSAGLPMLQVLRGSELTSVIAVVVRYFGGIKLGVGGLIRAYGSSVTQAIEAATILDPTDVYTMTLDFPYEFTNEVETHVAQHAVILDREYGETPVYTIELNEPSTMDVLHDHTRGHITMKTTDHRIDYLKGGSDGH